MAEFPEKKDGNLEHRVSTLEMDHIQLDRRIDHFRRELTTNTQTTKAVKADTEELVKIFNQVKGANILFIRIAKWITIVAGLFTAVVLAWHKIKGN